MTILYRKPFFVLVIWSNFSEYQIHDFLCFKLISNCCELLVSTFLFTYTSNVRLSLYLEATFKQQKYIHTECTGTKADNVILSWIYNYSIQTLTPLLNLSHYINYKVKFKKCKQVSSCCKDVFVLRETSPYQISVNPVKAYQHRSEYIKTNHHTVTKNMIRWYLNNIKIHDNWSDKMTC